MNAVLNIRATVSYVLPVYKSHKTTNHRILRKFSRLLTAGLLEKVFFGG